MSERTSYAPGTPCWVDLGTPDIDAAVQFYGGIFGWSIPEAENAEQTGGYRQAMLRGKPVAGVMPLMQEGQPPAWSTYVSVEDAEATAARIREAGGTVLAEPMDVMELGKMAIFADPAGAVFGIWQPGTFLGAGLVNEPGALTWNELNTRDVEGARAFYGAAFGWGFEENDMGEMGKYTTITLGGDPVGGILDLVERQIPDEVPNHWLVYFAVENADAAIDRARQSGANLMMGPVDIPVGRFGILTDPHGAAFAVIALSEEA